MIYFVQADILGYVKIGCTADANLDHRLSGLRTACPVELRLLGALPGGRKREAALHARFAEYRVRGEWFHPGPRLAHYLGRLQARETQQSRRKHAGPVQQAIVGHLRGLEAEAAALPLDIAAATGLKLNSVVQALRRMLHDQVVCTRGRAYVWARAGEVQA